MDWMWRCVGSRGKCLEGNIEVDGVSVWPQGSSSPGGWESAGLQFLRLTEDLAQIGYNLAGHMGSIAVEMTNTRFSFTLPLARRTIERKLGNNTLGRY